MGERELDVVVIGAGAPGEVIAGRLGEAGSTVAVVEERLVGGECSFFACMPSKALLRPGELTAEARRVKGVSVGDLDAEAVLARRDEVVHDLDDTSMLPWLEERGVTPGPRARAPGRGSVAWRGRRRAHGPPRSRRRDRELRDDPARSGAGGRAAVDERRGDDGEAGAGCVSFVLGGGVVGVEMAQAWSWLGSRVTLVHRGERLIEREEPFASPHVEDALREAGVEVRLGTSVTAVSRNGSVRVESTTATRSRLTSSRRDRQNAPHRGSGAGDGRARATEARRGRRDASACTGFDWLYAVGDVNGRALLTHMGKYQAAGSRRTRSSARTYACARTARLAAGDLHRPSGRCGRADARSRGGGGVRARVVEVETSGNAGGSFVGRERRDARLVVDEDRGTSSGPPSPGRRSPRRCTRPPSPWSARSASTTSGTQSLAFPYALGALAAAARGVRAVDAARRDERGTPRHCAGSAR